MSALSYLPDRLQHAVHRAFDHEHFLEVASSLVGDFPETSKVLELYVGDRRFSIVSPNPSFDEIYYRTRYPDVRSAIRSGDVYSGFFHFLAHGFSEGRFPRQAFEAQAAEIKEPLPAYTDEQTAHRALEYSRMCTLFWQNHSFFSALEVFNNLGRFLLSKADVSNSDFEDIAFRHFDASFYQQNYAELDSLIREESFRHYLLTGCRMGLSPNSKFDERFYLSFYDDVRLAVESGLLVCGFHHFLIAGRREGRLQKHSLSATLEARWRGVTAPVGVDHLSEFARKFQPPKAVAEPRSKKRLTVLLPDLNPDIFFGGYKAVIELIRLLVENGVDVRVVKMDSSYDGAHYFAFHNKGTELEHLFKDVVVQGKDAELAVAESDSFLAYSVWDAHCVAQLTKMTSDRRFIFLIQEYESIFFSNNSHKVLVEAAYDLPHYPVFNSRLLVKYFAHNKLGIFRGPSPAAGKFSVFEHVLPEPRQSRRSSNGPFTFFVYTRPEAHAGRNLFELCVMALRQAIDDYQPSSSWRFIGLVD